MCVSIEQSNRAIGLLRDNYVFPLSALRWWQDVLLSVYVEVPP